MFQLHFVMNSPCLFLKTSPTPSNTKFQNFAFKHKCDHRNGLVFHLYLYSFPPPTPTPLLKRDPERGFEKKKNWAYTPKSSKFRLVSLRQRGYAVVSPYKPHK